MEKNVAVNIVKSQECFPAVRRLALKDLAVVKFVLLVVLNPCYENSNKIRLNRCLNVYVKSRHCACVDDISLVPSRHRKPRKTPCYIYMYIFISGLWTMLCNRFFLLK